MTDSRIVVQITEDGTHLCNDGTMWLRTESVDEYNGSIVYSYTQINNVPQPDKDPMWNTPFKTKEGNTK